MWLTYDLTTDAGKVRALITDTNDERPILDDDEIQVFLDLEGGVIKRAAALALETIATNEALVLKVIQVLDLKTDGAKVADSLFKRADRLREQADKDEASGYAGFEIAEWAPSSFAGAEWLGRYGS